MFYDADAMRCRLHAEAVAQEAMRQLPVAPLQGAEPIEDTLIGDVLVPKGTPIYLLAGRAAKNGCCFLRAARL
jgi:cytochrome P450